MRILSDRIRTTTLRGAALFIALLVLAPAATGARQAEISVRTEPHPERILVVFDGEQPMEQHATFHLFHVDNPPRLVIDFPAAAVLPEDIGAALAPTAFSGFRYTVYPEKSRVVFDTDNDTLPAYSFVTTDNRLELSLPAGKAADSTVDPDDAVNRAITQSETATRAGTDTQTAPPPVPRKAKSRHSPDLVTVDFKEADLQNVFRFFADIKNLNVIMRDDVKGSVTLKLKNVPWRQAFDIVLKTHDLGMERDGNVIRIAPQSRFRAEKELLAQQKKAEVQLEDTRMEILKVNFATAGEIAPRLQTVLSDRGSTDTDERTNSVIVTDIPRHIKLARDMLDQLDMPIKQVLIEAKIVKLESSAVRDIGIQWGGVWADHSNDTYYGVSGSGVGSTGMPTVTPEGGPIIDSGYAVNLPASGATSGLGLIFGKVNLFNLNVRLSALKNRNRAQILSAPKVLALDNHQARIGQGLEIPYQTTSDEGTTTEFKKAELSLEVTPHITNNNNVSMDVSINKDSIGQQTSDGPAINTQNVETTLLLFNGETAVVGGIIERDDSKDVGEVPGLSNLPLVGDFLFKHKYDKTSQTELLIFLTPTVVPTRTASQL
ncbi:MAG: type IV pilus secretin PilQ [Deltaproteobacteria bacterium]|nr:type IV pilus secretin PilQ [Candidatus Anaeroferrophillacea bacterium]